MCAEKNSKKKKKRVGLEAILLLFSRLENRPKGGCAAGHKVAWPVIFRRATTDFRRFSPSVLVQAARPLQELTPGPPLCL